MLNVVMLNVFMLNAVMLNVTLLNVVMLNVVMLNVIMLNVVMLNVAMLNVPMLNVIMLNVVMLNVIMLNVVMLNVVLLNVVMLNVIMLNVVMLNVVMLNVVILIDVAPKRSLASNSIDKVKNWSNPSPTVVVTRVEHRLGWVELVEEPNDGGLRAGDLSGLIVPNSGQIFGKVFLRQKDSTPIFVVHFVQDFLQR
jgi:hypothetical protein